MASPRVLQRNRRHEVFTYQGGRERASFGSVRHQQRGERRLRAQFRPSSLPDMKHKHGFFLLLANPILDKASSFLSQVLAFLLVENSHCVLSLGLQKQSGDARAFSFLRILELIPLLSQPPVLLFVENVVGFETSDTHAEMIETLKSSGFVTQEFILSPMQFGVPYSRPRYFCLAKRNPLSFRSPCFNDKLIWCPSPLFVNEGEPVTDECLRPQDNWDKLLESCGLVEQFLEFKSTAGIETAEFGFENANIVSRKSDDPSKGHDERNGFSSTSMELYHVPLSLIERWGSAMDIVYPDSRRCCCFTKSYYRYVKGTGSLLATVEPETKGKGFPLKEQGLRYFTPREVANFHSFPEHFVFPDHVNLKQRYALLGNSLSVAVVAPLLHYLFTGPS